MLGWAVSVMVWAALSNFINPGVMARVVRNGKSCLGMVWMLQLL